MVLWKDVTRPTPVMTDLPSAPLLLLILIGRFSFLCKFPPRSSMWIFSSTGAITDQRPCSWRFTLHQRLFLAKKPSHSLVCTCHLNVDIQTFHIQCLLKPWLIKSTTKCLGIQIWVRCWFIGIQKFQLRDARKSSTVIQYENESAKSLS